jgi:hypothetical protein
MSLKAGFVYKRPVTTYPVFSRIGPPWTVNGNNNLQATVSILKITSGWITLLVYGF